MAGYLEEKQTGDGDILTWETPNRQRLWGLLGLGLPGIYLVLTVFKAVPVNQGLVVASVVVFFVSVLAATWTTKLTLNLKTGNYGFVKGFLPFLFGDRGIASEAFNCVVVRVGTMLDAARHENDPDAESFDQYTVCLVWKDPRRQAMLIDTMPIDITQSKRDTDFHQLAVQRAAKIANPLGISLLDQSVALAAVSIEEAAPTQAPVN